MCSYLLEGPPGAGGPGFRMNPNQEKEKSPLELYVAYLYSLYFLYMF